MMQVNMHDAKSSLSKLIQMLESGDEDVICIARNGEAIAQLTRIPKKTTKRIGAAAGKLNVPKDFDKWDDEVAKLFGSDTE